uniref:Rhodopsin n=1 Tax=Salix viminalis TaxID=40686 RepID=A0A6N2MYA7_SALVM
MSYQKVPHDPYAPPGYPPSAPPPPPHEGYPPPPPPGYPGYPPPGPPPHEGYPPPGPPRGYQGYFAEGYPPPPAPPQYQQCCHYEHHITRIIMMVAPRFYVDVSPHFVAVVCWSAASKVSNDVNGV